MAPNTIRPAAGAHEIREGKLARVPEAERLERRREGISAIARASESAFVEGREPTIRLRAAERFPDSFIKSGEVRQKMRLETGRHQGPLRINDGQILAANKFEIKRGLKAYRDIFGDFTKDLGSGVWWDMGAGMARAQLQYEGDARRIAVGFTKPQDETLDTALARLPRDKFDYWYGHYFEDYDLTHAPRADLITDYYGALSYTHHPDVVLNRYLQLLNVGGRAKLFMGYEGTQFADATGKRMTVYELLSRLPGLEVRSDPTQDGPVITVVKRAENARVPDLRERAYLPAYPPARFFSEGHAPATRCRIEMDMAESYAPNEEWRKYIVIAKQGSISRWTKLEHKDVPVLVPWHGALEEQKATRFGTTLNDADLFLGRFTDNSLTSVSAMRTRLSMAWRNREMHEDMLRLALSKVHRVVKPGGHAFLGPFDTRMTTFLTDNAATLGWSAKETVTVAQGKIVVLEKL